MIGHCTGFRRTRFQAAGEWLATVVEDVREVPRASANAECSAGTSGTCHSSHEPWREGPFGGGEGDPGEVLSGPWSKGPAILFPGLEGSPVRT